MRLSRFDVCIMAEARVRVRVFELRGTVYLPVDSKLTTGKRAGMVLDASLALIAAASLDRTSEELSQALEESAAIAWGEMQHD